jgi:hypothetical protein
MATIFRALGRVAKKQGLDTNARQGHNESEKGIHRGAHSAGDTQFFIDRDTGLKIHSCSEALSHFFKNLRAKRNEVSYGSHERFCSASEERN